MAHGLGLPLNAPLNAPLKGVVGLCAIEEQEEENPIEEGGERSDDVGMELAPSDADGTVAAGVKNVPDAVATGGVLLAIVDEEDEDRDEEEEDEEDEEDADDGQQRQRQRQQQQQQHQEGLERPGRSVTASTSTCASNGDDY